MASVILPQAIIAEASLSFLGLGVPPPEPSWGKDLADSRSVLATAPWLWLAPGAFIAVTVLSGKHVRRHAPGHVLDPAVAWALEGVICES